MDRVRQCKTPHIVVLGSMNADFTIQTSKIPAAGESLIGELFQLTLGGKGACQAVAAARMGAKVTMIGKVGADVFGERMLSVLRQEGIDTQFVVVDSSEATGAAFIILENSGQNRIISVPGVNKALTVQEVDAAAAIFDQADMLLLQLETNMAVVERGIFHARRAGIPVLLNPGPTPSAPLSDGLLSALACITPNEVEAEALTGIPVQTAADAAEAARKLYAKGIPQIVITLGENGAYRFDGQEGEWLPAIKVNALDTVGAGDTFTGTLAVELSGGSSFRDAVLFANRVAAVSVTRRGAIASIPQRSEVEAVQIDQLDD